jgi:hypothetical protein
VLDLEAPVRERCPYVSALAAMSPRPQERLELTARTSTSSNDPTNQQAVTLTPHDTLIHRP